MNAVVPTVPRRIPLLLWWLLAALAALVLAAASIHAGLQHLEGVPLHVVIDGHEATHSLDLAAMPPAHRVVLALGLAFAALLALLVVPVVLAAVFGAVLLALGLGLGLPLLAGALLLTIVFSPLIAIGAILWWALRRRPAPSATMPG